MLEFQGGTDSPVAGSQSQSSRQASNYSREVTSRSASKVTERVKKQVTLRKLREFEEKTGHTFDNSAAGGANVTGVYQWVEKVLRGQVFNYGRRLMFDIMVPEPAAFVQQAITGSSPVAMGLIKPAPFTLGIDNISEWNYSNLAASYGATGIEPPPQLWVTVSKTFASRNPNPTTNVAIAVEQPLPDGYQAITGWVHHKLNTWAGASDWHVEVTVGTAAIRADTSVNPNGWPLSLNNEVTSIPISFTSFGVEAYSISVEATCVRTARAMQAWQSRTHDAILRAYQQRLAEYEERLANLLASTRITSLAQSPDENKKLIKEELKKSCVSVFTYQHFDSFGAVELSPEGYVQVKLKDSEVQGGYIRFFEQAFEWEQMIYLFYPYFWGTKFFWLFKMRLDEVDPLFKDFLKAGEARVTVPVRPGFEKAVAHYLETGEIWDGKDPLDITSETYLPIMKEIQERDSVPERRPTAIRGRSGCRLPWSRSAATASCQGGRRSPPIAAIGWKKILHSQPRHASFASEGGTAQGLLPRTRPPPRLLETPGMDQGTRLEQSRRGPLLQHHQSPPRAQMWRLPLRSGRFASTLKPRAAGVEPLAEGPS